MSDERHDPAGRPAAPLPGEDALDAAFAAARAEGDPAAPLPEGFAARCLADAEAARPAPGGATLPASRPARGWLGRVATALAPAGGRGWGVAGGLAACAAAGLWLGYAPPAPLEGLAGALAGTGAALSPADLLAPLDAEPFDA